MFGLFKSKTRSEAERITTILAQIADEAQVELVQVRSLG